MSERDLQSRTPVAPVAHPAATPAVQAPVVETPEVRRAEHVPVTVKRAVFASWPVESSLDAGLRSDLVRFLGIKDTFADLPGNPQMGDAWGVKEDQTNCLWVWHQLLNYSRPAWHCGVQGTVANQELTVVNTEQKLRQWGSWPRRFYPPAGSLAAQNTGVKCYRRGARISINFVWIKSFYRCRPRSSSVLPFASGKTGANLVLYRGTRR